MDIRIHVPEIHRRPFFPAEVSATRRLFLARTDRPSEIGFRIPTPDSLRAIDGPFKHSLQLAVVGSAVLGAIHGEPRFHVSIVKGEFVQATGTTIALSGRDRDNRDVILGTWDYGEPAGKAIARMGEYRKIFSLAPAVAAEYANLCLSPHLPPPQALISNVMMDDPRISFDMTLGGCSEGIPIAVAFGRKDIHVRMDHRIFDWDPDEKLLASRLLDNLS